MYYVVVLYIVFVWTLVQSAGPWGQEGLEEVGQGVLPTATLSAGLRPVLDPIASWDPLALEALELTKALAVRH